LIHLGYPIWALLFPWYAKRLAFERRNLFSPCPRLDLSIHVSSEGELEQVLPLCRSLGGKRSFEIIYTSESLEGRIQKLELDGLVWTWRLPLIDYGLFGQKIEKLIKGKLFLMVRYDFFPELITHARRKEIRSILINATLKSKKENLAGRAWHQYIYNSFDYIIAASAKDQKRFEKMLPASQVSNFDFRIPQILERQKKALGLGKIAGLEERLRGWIGHTKRNDCIVFGSSWSEDFNDWSGPDIDNLKGKKIYLAPHKIKGEECQRFISKVKSVFKEVSIWRSIDDIQRDDSVVISLIPGILCEIFPYFGLAYIGGGFNRSIHSVLEPYWGSEIVICGPKTHRSTEYDLIVEWEPEAILRVDRSEELPKVLCQLDSGKIDLKKRIARGEKYCVRGQEITRLIEEMI
jgi:3-deoxy-D-manno-octulosonic-acid transferase